MNESQRESACLIQSESATATRLDLETLVTNRVCGALASSLVSRRFLLSWTIDQVPQGSPLGRCLCTLKLIVLP